MIKENSKYKHCSHHHELTNNHEVITIDGEEIVVNKDAKLLIQEMNRLGLKTRTHHVDSNGGFVLKPHTLHLYLSIAGCLNIILMYLV